MKSQDFDKLRKQLSEECELIMQKKGASYSGQADRHANFKRIADRLGLSPLQVWAAYFMKHVDSLLQYVKDGTESPEGVEGNFKDVRNYIDLGYGLICEKKSLEADDKAVLGNHNIPCPVCGHFEVHYLLCHHKGCACSYRNGK